MTVTSTNQKITFNGDGSTTVFAYNFKIFAQADLLVVLRVTATGVETTQTLAASNYSVSGVGATGGGNVTMATAPASGTTLTILREQPNLQGLDLVPNDPFPAGNLEDTLDKLTFQIQTHSEELSRTMRFTAANTINSPEFAETVAERANKIFSFDASGNLQITQELGVARGNWATNTAYNNRDIISDTSNSDVYIVNTAHTSSGSLPISTNANAAKYTLLVDASKINNVVTDPAPKLGGDLQSNGHDIKMADADKLIFGTDLDVTLEYDEATTNSLKIGAQAVTVTSDQSNKPIFSIENTSNNSSGPKIYMINTRTGSSGQAGDNAGTIEFRAENAAGEQTLFANINATSTTVTNGSEGGRLSLEVASHDGGSAVGLFLADGNQDNEVDVTIGSTATSLTTVAGTLTMGSTATLNNSGVLQTAAQTNITSLGTLTTLVVDHITIDDDDIISDAALNITTQNSGDIHLKAAGGQTKFVGTQGEARIHIDNAATPSIQFTQTPSGGSAATTTLKIVDPTAARTISLPNASDTLVGKATTDTLTNKTLASATLTGTSVHSGILDITNNTAASDATGDTGALRTEGGASIARNLFVGGGFTALSSTLLYAADGDFLFYADANHTKLFHNGAIRLTTSSTGITMNGVLTVNTIASTGSSSNILIKHNTNTKVTVKSTGIDVDGSITAIANTGAVLAMETGDNSIADGDVLGKITFRAPFDNAGDDGDARLIAAGIEAVAEGNFSDTSNATELVFKTAVSEVASTKMTLSSGGNLAVTGGFAANDGSTITTADNTDTLSLISTDAGTSVAPNLSMYRNSGSPAANDQLGQIQFTGKNASAEDVDYAVIGSQIIDPTDGSEDGRTFINSIVAGQMHSRIDMQATETVINNEHLNLDFRVESDTHTHAFYVDGETGGVLMGDTAAGLGAGTPDAGRLILQSLNNSAQLNMFRSDTSISGGDSLGLITAYSNDTDGNSIEPLVQIQFEADGAFNANDNPTKMVFLTTPDNTETMREVGLFSNTGVFTANYGMIVNETGTSNATGDFRVETVNNTHMLVVDGGDDYVAIGSADQNNGGLLNLNAVSGSTVLTMTTRSGTDAHTNIFTMFKTPATSGTPTATASGDILGDIRFMGVNTSAVADIGAQIVVEQTGTASGTVPAQMSFVTNEATAMSINSAGNIGMGATGTNIDAKLHVVGSALVGTAAANTTIDDSLSTGLDVAVGSGTKAFQVWDDGDTTTPRLAVLRNGNVGIGVSIPQCKLDIDVAVDTSLGLRSQSGIIVAQYTGAPAVGRRAQIGLGYGNTYTNVSIGAVRTSAAAYGTDDFIIATKSGTADAAPTEWVRINSAGNVLTGCKAVPSASVAGFCVTGTSSGNISSSGSATTGYNHLMFFNGNGSVGSISTSGSATTYSTSSDYRLKTDAQPMTGASARVLALKPVNFEWIADGTRTDGFLAHEAQAVVPEAVTGTKDAMQDEEYQVSAATGDIYTPATVAYVDEDGNAVDAVDEVIHSADAEQPETLEDGQQWRETTAAVMGTRSVPDMQGIDQGKMVPLLVASLQEALTEIAALKVRITALEGA